MYFLIFTLTEFRPILTAIYAWKQKISSAFSKTSSKLLAVIALKHTALIPLRNFTLKDSFYKFLFSKHKPAKHDQNIKRNQLLGGGTKIKGHPNSKSKLRKVLIFAAVLSFLFISLPIAGAKETGTNNVIVYWTDGKKLKAATLTCLRTPPAPVGIVAIPLYTIIKPGNSPVSVEEYYYKKGREALTAHLEELFGIPIDSYVHVEQDTLQKFSDIMGPLQVGTTSTSLVEVFEGTYTKGPVNLQWEIRAVAGSMLTPSVFLKIPQLVWVFSTEIDSNLKVDHFLALHRIIRGCGPNILQKQRIPGTDYRKGSKKYRIVPPDAWAQTLRAVTTKGDGSSLARKNMSIE